MTKAELAVHRELAYLRSANAEARGRQKGKKRQKGRARERWRKAQGAKGQ